MNKRKKILAIVIFFIVVIIIAGVVCLYPKWQMSKSYSIAYLSTGEIYVGKLSYLPFSKFKLSDPYQFQAVKDAEDETKANFQLFPLKDALWAPKEIYLNSEQVIFYGPLEETSEAGKALRDGN